MIEWSVRCDCCNKTIVDQVYEFTTEHNTIIQYCSWCYFHLKQADLLPDTALPNIRHSRDVIENMMKKV